MSRSMMRHRLTPVLACALLLASCVSAQQPAMVDRPPCSGEPYERLDFWLGSWEVNDPEGRRQGANLIEKTLDGCVVRERWTGASGGRGESLFYFHRAESRWKQVWVTGTGFVKEKAEVAGYTGPGLRFQGEVLYPGRGTLLDRTTLTPREDGTVRQVIEVSEDEGATWRATFDGIYTPHESPHE